MWQLGWVAGNDGNVSVKINKSSYLVTPSGVSKGDITPEMIIKVNPFSVKEETPIDSSYYFASLKLRGGEPSSHEVKKIGVEKKEYKPSSELAMHLCCYEERDDVKAVIHTHSPYATAFAVANRLIDSDELVELSLTIGDVPVAPFAKPGTDEVGSSIAPLLSKHNVILLQNHGSVAVGSDLKEAFTRLETLELCAKTLIYAEMLNKHTRREGKNYEK
jgi:L-fuculose-phosphate aldolase